MLKILADQLPPGAQLLNLDPGMVKVLNYGHERGFSVQYDDGAGRSTLMVTMADRLPPAPSSGAVPFCTGPSPSDQGPRRPGYEQPACAVVHLANGDTLRTWTSATDMVGLYDDAVQLIRPSGEYVQISAANATLDQHRPGDTGPAITVTRDKPPLGTAGWAAVAESPQWQLRIPRSLADAGVAFAGTVSRFPCAVGLKPADCAID
jgi:hypothetical protein